MDSRQHFTIDARLAGSPQNRTIGLVICAGELVTVDVTITPAEARAFAGELVEMASLAENSSTEPNDRTCATCGQPHGDRQCAVCGEWTGEGCEEQPCKGLSAERRADLIERAAQEYHDSGAEWHP